MTEPVAAISRRSVLRLASMVAGLVAARGLVAQAAAPPGPGGPTADEALQRLLAGNQRFMKGETTNPRRAPDDFRPLAAGQRPMATILGCADSRVAPELLFDQGVGDLVIVLGHSECGAVKAAIKHMDDRDPLPGAIGELVNRIRPAVTKVSGMPGDRLSNAIRANVAIGVEILQGLQPIIAPAVKRGQIRVVGALYDLRTGGVTLTA